MPLCAQIGFPGQRRGPDGPPRLSRDPKPAAPQSDTLTRTSGTIQKIDDASIVIETSDGRVLDCKRSPQTRFYKDSREVRSAGLHPGDQVSVESSEDDKGYLHARNVYFEKAAAEAQADTASAEPATVRRESPDLHPPELKRGRPAKNQNAGGDDDDAAAAPAPAPAAPAGDPVIEKARAATVSYSQKLPNYICREFMTRYLSRSRPVNWEAQDVVSTDVVYEDGAEKYGNVAIDGKPVNKQLEQLDGAWSTGEFGTILRDLFSPYTNAVFQFRRYSTAAGFDARVYDFDVERSHSHWQIQMASQSVRPAYHGSVWIDPQTGHVLRIEMQAKDLPEEFPLDTVESAVDYAYVRIGEGGFLLPSHAESLACRRGSSNCSRNTIDFRNYRKYNADTRITF
jgi:hypothetical protein